MESLFQEKKKIGKIAFIAYVCAGDPNFEKSLEILYTLAEEGVDIIEIGIPFSDPIADGPINQMASERALKEGINIEKVLNLTREFRKKKKTPIVYFTYVNPIYSYGIDEFQKKAIQAGANGILLLDDSSGNLLPNCEDLPQIRLISPSTSKERMKEIALASKGFLYLISRKGVTGGGGEINQDLQERISFLRKYTDIPICVGFGIHSAKQIQALRHQVDGVIVGSTIVNAIAQSLDKNNFIEEIKKVIKPLIKSTQ